MLTTNENGVVVELADEWFDTVIIALYRIKELQPCPRTVVNDGYPDDLRLLGDARRAIIDNGLFNWDNANGFKWIHSISPEGQAVLDSLIIPDDKWTKGRPKAYGLYLGYQRYETNWRGSGDQLFVCQVRRGRFNTMSIEYVNLSDCYCDEEMNNGVNTTAVFKRLEKPTV